MICITDKLYDAVLFLNSISIHCSSEIKIVRYTELINVFTNACQKITYLTDNDVKKLKLAILSDLSSNDNKNNMRSTCAHINKISHITVKSKLLTFLECLDCNYIPTINKSFDELYVRYALWKFALEDKYESHARYLESIQIKSEVPYNEMCCRTLNSLKEHFGNPIALLRRETNKEANVKCLNKYWYFGAIALILVFLACSF